MDEVEKINEQKKLTEVTIKQKLGLGVKVLISTVVLISVVAGVFVALSLAK